MVGVFKELEEEVKRAGIMKERKEGELVPYMARVMLMEDKFPFDFV